MKVWNICTVKYILGVKKCQQLSPEIFGREITRLTKLRVCFPDMTWLHSIIFRIINYIAIYNGQLNALFDAKEMKCYFINFYCQEVIFLSDVLLCWRRLSHVPVHKQLSLWLPTSKYKVVTGNFSLAASSSQKPDPNHTGLGWIFPTNNVVMDQFVF